jgi:hypothetical protein
MVRDVITLFLANIPFWMLLLCLLLAWFKRGTRDAFFYYMLLLPIGISGLWASFFQVFYPEFVANSIGWQASPFLFEVAMSNLAVGVAGITAFKKRSFEFGLAVVLINSIFLWGAAFGHIREIIEAHNYAPNNAGLILLTDILIPVFSWIAAWRTKA